MKSALDIRYSVPARWKSLPSFISVGFFRGAAERIRAPDLTNVLLSVVAVVASILIFRRALHGLDQDWDTFAYHLPFAARLAGTCDKACYGMMAWHEARFDGFPMFATWLQSVIWRVADKPDWNDLINIAGLAVFVATARIYLRAPIALLVAALLTVPLIQIHLSVTYIDLFSNTMIATAVVLLAVFSRRSQRRGEYSSSSSRSQLPPTANFRCCPLQP